MAIKPIQILINAKDEASGVFSRLQAKIAAVGAAVATYFGIQAFVGWTKGAADFEGAMSRVQAATGATGKEMAQLTKAAQDAGTNTQFTATAAAGALENLAKAGLTSAQAIEALPAVMNLAQAADVDLAQSAEIVTKAVAGMGLAFGDSARVADVLALGANATNSSVVGLAQALSYAAPSAQSLGVSLEGTVAIMGKLADAGIDASRSGTAMANVMSQFSDSASQFRQELALAGITTNNFEEALHQLAAAGPRGEKAILAVGLNAGPALRALLNQGMPALDELKGKLDAAAGSAAAAARVMADNLQGSMKSLGGVWTTVTNALTTPILPVLKEGVDQLAASLRTAVGDGTIAKFGSALATAFQQALNWMREFAAAIDFDALKARLTAFAEETGAALTRIGEYATTAGNTVSLAWNAMAAGVNVVLTAVYGLGSVFATVAAGIMTGVAKLREGLAKVTFGGLSESFKLAAEDARSMAEGFSQAAGDMRTAATSALQDAADRAQATRDAFGGLVEGIAKTGAAASAAAPVIATIAHDLDASAKAADDATAAIIKKMSADASAVKAQQDHAAALGQMRAEYEQLIASGNLQQAAVLYEKINAKLRETPAAGQAAAQAAQDTAKQVEAAFQRLGVTSAAALSQQAAASQRDYNTIRDSGLATAEDLTAAFKKAAEDAIAANKGIAPTWVEAQAGVRGYTVETDSAGKSVLRLTDEVRRAADASGQASGAMQGHWRAVGQGVDEATAALERQISSQEKAFQLAERAAELERKRRGVDKEGFSVDKNGNRQIITVATPESTFNQAKSANLSDEATLNLVQSLFDSRGKPVRGPEMTQRGIDFQSYINLKINQALMQEARDRVSGQPAGAGLSGRTTSQVVNLYYNGSSMGSVSTDEEGAANIENFMRSLEKSKRSTGRR